MKVLLSQIRHVGDYPRIRQEWVDGGTEYYIYGHLATRILLKDYTEIFVDMKCNVLYAKVVAFERAKKNKESVVDEEFDLDVIPKPKCIVTRHKCGSEQIGAIEQ